MQKKDREGTRSDPVISAVQGNFDHLMGQIRAIVNAHNLMVSDLEEIQSALNGVNDDAAEIVAGLIQEMSHGDLDGVTPDQHHNKVHDHSGNPEGGTLDHDDLTGVSADDHHARQHAINAGADHTGILDDAQIPAAIARDAEVAAAIAVHAAIEAAHGMELDDVTDVNAPAPSDGQVLTWDSTPGEWVPAAGSSGSDGTDHNILDHADADTPPVPADGDVLTWDATPGEWIAAAPTGGGGGGGTPQPIEERSIVMWRDSDFSAQLRNLWDLENDPATEATLLTSGNMSVGFNVHADDDANSSTEDGGGLIKGTSTADPDYWGTTHAANSVLELDEGVYVWSAAFWFGGATMDPEDYMTAQMEYAQDPTLISAYASNRSMPGSWGGDNTLHSANSSTYQFRKDGILFVPSGGAKYILYFSPQFADPAMYCYHVSFWLGRADAMGAATATANEEHIFPMSTAETLIDGDQAPTFFMPFAGTLQWVAASGVARSTDIDVDLLKNGVSVFTGTLPVAPAAGGRGTKVIPTTTAVADGDELTINLSGSNGDGRLVAYVSVVPD